MDLQQIERRLKKVVSEQLGVAQADLKPETKFIEDLGADSLDVVELLFHIDEEFDIEIPDDDAALLQTYGQTLQYLTQKLGVTSAVVNVYGAAQDVTVQLNLDDETLLNNLGGGNATAGVRALIAAHRAIR